MDRKQIKTPQRGAETARMAIGQRIKKRRKELTLITACTGQKVIFKASKQKPPQL